MRFCNRYVSDVPDALGAGNVVAGAASTDLLDALALIDGYKAGEVHVTGINGDVQIARGQRQAFLRGVRLPRRARAGKKVPATLRLRHVRGRLEKRKVMLRLPRDLRPGKRRSCSPGPTSIPPRATCSSCSSSISTSARRGRARTAEPAQTDQADKRPCPL